MALSPGGIALAFMMPIAGILASKFDPRVIIACGFAITSFGLFHVTNIYLGVGFGTMAAYRVIQVIGIPLIFIPISTLNYVGVLRSAAAPLSFFRLDGMFLPCRKPLPSASSLSSPANVSRTGRTTAIGKL
jgi:DHA2 family multidrug resistance protein